MGGGSVVSGTGMCQCFAINDAAEVCDATCQKTKPKTVITSDGMVRVTDPTTFKANDTDPSTIPGYYGNFKATSKTGAKEAKAVFMDVGENFGYSGDTNSDILEQTAVDDKTDKTQVI